MWNWNPAMLQSHPNHFVLRDEFVNDLQIGNNNFNFKENAIISEEVKTWQPTQIGIYCSII